MTLDLNFFVGLTRPQPIHVYMVYLPTFTIKNQPFMLLKIWKPHWIIPYLRPKIQPVNFWGGRVRKTRG